MKNEPLNLFLSYGHSQETANIKNEILHVLKKRNHNIWVDNEKIFLNDDWREKIAEGLYNSHGIIALLSNWSTRINSETNMSDRSVCLDELSIAVSIPGKNIVSVLLEKGANIPNTISKKQWLDISEWKEYYGTENWSFWFDAKMEELINAIENKDNYVFQGEINSLQKSLQPLINDTKYSSLLSKKMVGRQWLIDQISNWEERNKTKFFHIVANPGVGKSHFISHLVHYNPNVVAVHFCEWSKSSNEFISQLIRGLAFQFATRNDEFRFHLNKSLDNNIFISSNCEKEKAIYDSLISMSNHRLFEILFEIPTSRMIYGNSESLYIVIDGIDEALNINSSYNDLVDILTSDALQRLPNWIKFIITSRPESDLMAQLNYLRKDTIFMDEYHENADDISEYLSKRLSVYKVSADTISILSKKCNGVFIYAEKLCDAINDEIISLDNICEIPSTIYGLYYCYFRRLFNDKALYKKYYDAICMMIYMYKVNLTVDSFCSILQWSNNDLNSFITHMKSFVILTENDNKENYLSFYHKSLFDWLSNKEKSAFFFADEKIAEKRIKDFCVSNYINGTYTTLSYELCKLIFNVLSEDKPFHKKIDNDDKFLYYIQNKAYTFSDLNTSDKAYDKLTNGTFDNSSTTLPQRATALKAECEISKCNYKEAKELLMVIDEQKIYQDPITYVKYKENLVWCEKEFNIDNSLTLLEELSDYIINSNFSNESEKYEKLSLVFYDKSVILWRIAQKQIGKTRAQTTDEAISNANTAIDYTNKYHRDKDGFLCLLYNQVAWCQVDKKDYDNAIKNFEESLKTRKNFYGYLSRYTSTAYDNLARGILYKYRYLKIDSQQSNSLDLALDNAMEAKKINKVLFGNKSLNYARNLETIAMIYKEKGKKDLALEAANESLNIYKYNSNGALEKRLTDFINLLN